MNTPRTPDRTGSRTHSAQGSEGHLFTQSQAAKACGVSTSTIRTAREKGRLDFDRAEDGSIRIPLAALLAAGFNPQHAGTARKNTPTTGAHTLPHSAAQHTAHTASQDQDAALKDELGKLRQEAAEWRVRALVAEAQAQERKDALDSTRLTLRAIEAATSTQNNTLGTQLTEYASAPLGAQGTQLGMSLGPASRTRWRDLFWRDLFRKTR